MKKKTTAPLKIDEILLKNRQVFLNEGVTDASALRVSKEIMALDLDKKAPIYFWLNSPGGSCAAGLALINVMRRCKSKIITIINTEVCSMGGHISVAGHERWMVKNGVWMAHDMSGGIGGDYSLKVRDRADFLEKWYAVLEENLKKYTKLSASEYHKARTGELWLFADECLKRGIIDKVI